MLLSVSSLNNSYIFFAYACFITRVERERSAGVAQGKQSGSDRGADDHGQVLDDAFGAVRRSQGPLADDIRE